MSKDTKLKSPCNECIVDAMCKKVCGKLGLYINNSFKVDIPNFSTGLILYWLRACRVNVLLEEVQLIYTDQSIVSKFMGCKETLIVIENAIIKKIEYHEKPIKIPMRRGLIWDVVNFPSLEERVGHTDTEKVLDRYASWAKNWAVVPYVVDIE